MLSWMSFSLGAVTAPTGIVTTLRPNTCPSWSSTLVTAARVHDEALDLPDFALGGMDMVAAARCELPARAPSGCPWWVAHGTYGRETSSCALTLLYLLI